MKVKKSFLFYTSFIVIIISASVISCSKCHDKTYPPLKLSGEDLMVIPYTGNETLIFSDSTNDSIVFKGTVRNQYMMDNTYFDFYGCTNDYESENCGCYFEGSNYIELKIGFAGRTYESIRKYFFFEIRLSDELNIYHFIGDYTINNDSILPGQDVSFADSLQLGTARFSSVYILFSQLYQMEEERIDFVYYTTKEGIIAFKTNRQHLWVIKTGERKA